MAIKNILVAYNGMHSSDAALRGALLMQRIRDAHITGILPRGGSNISSQILPWMPDSVRKSIDDIERRAAAAIEEKFRAACANAPQDKIHWIESSDEADATVAEYSRMFDITILGVHEDAPSQHHIELHPDRIAYVSGRPALIFPAGHTDADFNDYAILAWDGGRTAARAMHDAMQILETKKRVDVVSVGRGYADRALPGIDVKTTLERHGVSVEIVELPRKGKSVAEILIEYGRESKASVMVMGAYEHSKFREDFFGGVTNEVLQKTAIPVLVSH